MWRQALHTAQKSPSANLPICNFLRHNVFLGTTVLPTGPTPLHKTCLLLFFFHLHNCTVCACKQDRLTDGRHCGARFQDKTVSMDNWPWHGTVRQTKVDPDYCRPDRPPLNCRQFPSGPMTLPISRYGGPAPLSKQGKMQKMPLDLNQSFPFCFLILRYCTVQVQYPHLNNAGGHSSRHDQFRQVCPTPKNKKTPMFSTAIPIGNSG